MLVIKNETYTLTLDSTGNAQIPGRTIGNTMPMALVITSSGNYNGKIAVNSHGVLYAQAFDFGSDNKKATNITVECKLYYIEM